MYCPSCFCNPLLLILLNYSGALNSLVFFTYSGLDYFRHCEVGLSRSAGQETVTLHNTKSIDSFFKDASSRTQLEKWDD